MIYLGWQAPRFTDRVAFSRPRLGEHTLEVLREIEREHDYETLVESGAVPRDGGTKVHETWDFSAVRGIKPLLRLVS